MRITTARKRIFGVKRLQAGDVVTVPFKQGRLLTRLGKGWSEAPPDDLGAQLPPPPPPPAEPAAQEAPKRGRGRPPALPPAEQPAAAVAEGDGQVSEGSTEGDGSQSEGADTVEGSAAEVTGESEAADPAAAETADSAIDQAQPPKAAESATE